ncbi:hypothetical protein FGG69_gp53 [Salinibacter phage SRUTV-1]|uniref:Uncharacterized protein n=1 Tax=Salinibacter phage SRUTV-1 TaxID=2684227 RepID=A0A2D3FAK9_9CAUD|nr:hypothetical protein FGG69_gp53 [Salinibacter phage SRUTV-1]ATU47036.1 hypothetical protein [Salinibacter phage SRUTV-1]
MDVTEEDVAGYCHLFAHALAVAVPSEMQAGIVAAETREDGNRWHYGLLLEDGRVLDSKGGWPSIHAFREAANEKWERDFRVSFVGSIPEKEIECFEWPVRAKCRRYAHDLIKQTDL